MGRRLVREAEEREKISGAEKTRSLWVAERPGSGACREEGVN